MKLDNRGWGLAELLVWCGVLLIFLLIAVFFIIQLSKSLGEAFKDSLKEDKTTISIEENVENASLKYMKDNYKDIGSGTITITIDNLKNGKYLNEKDITYNGAVCNGYALITKKDNKLNSDAYIRCGEYMTVGFQEWRIGA